LSIGRVVAEVQLYFFSIGQVFMPKRVYAGQNLNIPVNNGSTPIQPQGVKIPVAAKMIKTIPAMMRNALSALPTFIFIFFSV